MKNIYISSKLESKPEVFNKTHIAMNKFCMFNLIDYYNIILSMPFMTMITKSLFIWCYWKLSSFTHKKALELNIIKLKRSGLKWYHTVVNEIANGGKEIFYRISSCSFSDEKKNARDWNFSRFHVTKKLFEWKDLHLRERGKLQSTFSIILFAVEEEAYQGITLKCR